MKKNTFEIDPGFRQSSQYPNHLIDRWSSHYVDHGNGTATYRGKTIRNR